ncbi:MAG: shikimate dehydrogenase [Xanthomonadaceae bacterium]|nr:shikimate dehydrogenase [Xanthomonadaceae bacterium]
MGKPLNHSLSPKIHNTVFRQAGINAIYLSFPVAPSRVGAAVAGIQALNISGVNVTIPHKEAVFEYLDQLDDAARDIGAVNTISLRGGRLYGFNTDWSGFIDSLEHHKLALTGCRIVLLGSGGSAKAILYALGEKNCKEIELFNRTIEKAAAAAKHFSRLFPQSRFKACSLEDFFQDEKQQQPTMIIDTLPAAIAFEPPPWLIKNNSPVTYYTINYGTAAALKKVPSGWTRIDGLEMLIRQAMYSFLIWMGDRFTLGEAENLYGKVYEDIQSQT